MGPSISFPPTSDCEKVQNMRIYTKKVLSTVLILAALVASVFIFTGVGQADDHRKLKGWIERSERDRSVLNRQPNVVFSGQND